MTEFSSVTTGTGECNEDQLGSKNGASTTIWTSTDLLSALKKMGVKWLGLFVCLLCTSALATHKSRFWVWFGNEFLEFHHTHQTRSLLQCARRLAGVGETAGRGR